MAEKPWKELTPSERSARMTEGKRLKALARKQEAARVNVMARPHDPDPPPEDDEGEGAPATVPLGEEPEESEALNARAERRHRLLGDIDPEVAALISDADLDKIEREAIEEAIAENKRLALSLVKSRAKTNARVAQGLVSDDVLRTEEQDRRMHEKVRVRVNLPEGGGALGFRVDGEFYRNGETYTIPRHVYDSLKESHYRIHLNETRFSALNQDKVFRPGDSQAGLTAAQILLGRNPPPFEVLY